MEYGVWGVYGALLAIFLEGRKGGREESVLDLSQVLRTIHIHVMCRNTAIDCHRTVTQGKSYHRLNTTQLV